MPLGMPEPLESVPEDPRIAPIRAFVASQRNLCNYGAQAEGRGGIQYSVASPDLSIEALGAEVDRFYADRMSALIVLAPPGFNIQTGEQARATDMARRMNRAVWLAFARHATADRRRAQPDVWTDAYYESLWQRELAAADLVGRAVQPCDAATSYNIQAMGPWYKNDRHYRSAPGDLFLLMVRMSDIRRLQEAAGQRENIRRIRHATWASTDGLVDFQALVVPEDLDDLDPLQRIIVAAQRRRYERDGTLS